MGSERSSPADDRRHRERARQLARALVRWLVLSALALAGCEGIAGLDREALFHPERTRPDPLAATRIEGLERWWIEGDGVRTEAWYLPPLGEQEAPGPAVIFAHGNQSLIEEAVAGVEPYRRMGFAVLLPEYRGYGRSAGTPSEAGIVQDFEGFYDRLATRPEVDPGRIVFHGRSLGGGVVGVLASRRTAVALVLESTFTNVPDLASQWMVPAGFVRDRFDTRAVLTRASMPVLIMHGLDDTVVPFKHARELHRVAWDSRLVGVPDAGHSLPHDEEYWGRVRGFLVEAHVIEAGAIDADVSDADEIGPGVIEADGIEAP